MVGAHRIPTLASVVVELLSCAVDEAKKEYGLALNQTAVLVETASCPKLVVTVNG